MNDIYRRLLELERRQLAQEEINRELIREIEKLQSMIQQIMASSYPVVS
jgi:cell fate (sporulation/competence/biofilm development) regulator YlbF (YheA/YmcA/DUF963 family)